MDVWLILLMYVAGLALVVAEILLPGIVLGLVGFGALVVATVFGFRYHWGMGVGQVAVALGVVPLLFFWGTRRIRLRTTLSAESGSVGFVKNYAALLGKEGETVTDLRPAGIVRIEGGKWKYFAREKW